MAFIWSDSLSVGIALIDDQHKGLFERINRLIAASGQGRGKAELGQTVEFLNSYARSHFGDEERYMARIGYPELATQRAQHRVYVDGLTELRARLERDGATSELVIVVQRQACDWLVNHINKRDKAIGAFASKK